jgi:hypothetical protein
MHLSRPLIAFLAAWGAILTVVVGYVIFDKLTTTEPGFKFGESAPYVALAIFGGLGGFIASLAAMLATVVYERTLRQVAIGQVLGAACLAAVPFAAGAWYTATHSPLSESGTIGVWFLASFLVFLALLHAPPPKHEA